jgi:hypothetical protein
MATTLDVISNRVSSICGAVPFQFIEAISPFDFAQQPTTQIDQVFRIEYSDTAVFGGLNYSETRIGQVRIFVARKQKGTPQDAYELLAQDATALIAAVVHDGATGGGDYDVQDQGRGFTIQHDKGQEYAVLRLTLPINYEVEL